MLNRISATLKVLSLVATSYLYQESMWNMASVTEEVNFKLYWILLKFELPHQASDYHISTIVEFMKSKHRLPIFNLKNLMYHKLLQYTLRYI